MYKIITLNFLFFVLVLFCSVAHAESKDKSGIKNLFKEDSNNGTLNISSGKLALDAKNKVFVYSENVEITQGALKITSDTALGKYNESNQIEVVTCSGNVVITKNELINANADKAIYYVKEDKIELTEGPELVNDTNILIADRIIIYVKEDRSEAQGDVRVKIISKEKQGL